MDMYYKIHGDGYPLLMIQGYGGGVEDWDAHVPRAGDLSKHYKTVTIDNRGAGRSSAPPSKYTIRAMADDAAALLDALKIPEAHVLGSSMGGMIAQELAINHPEKVKGLLLLYTGPGGSLFKLPGQMENFEKLRWFYDPPPGMSLEAVMDQVLQIVYHAKYLRLHRDEIMSAQVKHPTSPLTLEKQYAAMMRFDATKRLKKIRSRTLVVHGEDDALLFPDGARYIAERVPGAELKMFKEAGHGVSEEKWEQVKEAILDFLSRIEVQG